MSEFESKIPTGPFFAIVTLSRSFWSSERFECLRDIVQILGLKVRACNDHLSTH